MLSLEVLARNWRLLVTSWQRPGRGRNNTSGKWRCTCININVLIDDLPQKQTHHTNPAAVVTLASLINVSIRIWVALHAACSFNTNSSQANIHENQFANIRLTPTRVIYSFSTGVRLEHPIAASPSTHG